MASEATITVEFKGDMATAVDLLRRMAAEISDCYENLDRIGTLIGEGYPRNEDLMADTIAFIQTLDVGGST